MWDIAVSVWVWTALTILVPAQSSPPVITDFLQRDLVNPEDVKAGAEVGFRLPCKATGSNLKWTWEHDGTAIAAYNGRPFTLNNDGTLTGSRLYAADSGTYQCFVRDEETGAVAFSRKLKVAVTVVGAFIDEKSVVLKVNLGDPFSYDCPPHKHSYGVVYSWGNVDGSAQHTFARNERRSISSNGTLFIMYLTQDDIDEIDSYKGIKCIMSGANSFQRSGTLRLEKIDKHQNDSENSTLPAWSVTPSAEETAVQGRNKTLFCFASGRPSPTITWKKDGELIQHEESSFKISRSFYGRRLFIHNVDKEQHEGTYTCEAQNDLNTENPISFNFRLNVEVPPRWAGDPPPKNITIVIEKNGTLECKVTANPAAVVSWYKDGQLLQSSERHILAGRSLHLIDVHLNDSGVYQCDAVNEHGMIISSTWINVAAWKPSFANAQFGPFHLLNKKEAKLPCKPTTAAPRPTYEWFKNGELITYDEDSRYRLEMDGTLVIKEVDKDQDNINYTCKAKNFKGEDSVTTVPIVLVPPRLTTEPINQTVIEGAMATFYCTASGYPNPKITWIKDEKIVATGDTLSFETSRNHSGEYWCSAENGLNVTVKASASLNVLYKPSLTTVPTDQTIIEDAMAAFHCVATGNPKPKVTWIKDGVTVTTGNTLSLQAKKDLSGIYWCSADNGLNSTVNASAYLDVQFPPSLITRPTDQTIMENEEVTLNCTASGNPTPTITWIKNGKTVTEGETLSFEAHRSQSGQYWCLAENGLEVSANASAYLDVQFAPSLIATPADQTVTESDKAIFHCNATGNPTPKITWIKDGNVVGEGDTLSFDTNRNHSGKYWCLADNGLNSTVNASANLDVQFSPSLKTKPTDQTVMENQEVTFHCTADGNPTPEISWIKDGETVALGEILSFKASRSHSGKYWCSAENGLDTTANASAYLDVQFLPSLITTPADQTVTESDTATFHCNATGNPTPKITWIKDGKTVGQGDTLSFETNRNHSGKYWCSAENGLNSTANASASLDVQYPPSLTTKPSDQTLIENQEVSFHCAATGNPNPEITWIKDGKTVGNGGILSFKVKRSHSGIYWCSAENGLDATVNTSAYLDVQFAPSLTTTPADLTVIESATATFHCNATGHPTPTMSWIKDGKTVGQGDTLSFETNRNHSGKYWCSVENGLNSTANASANLDVQYPPILTTKPSDKTIIENQELTFHCTATGNPTPKVTWTKDGKMIAQGDILSFEAKRNRSGKYWCSAENGVGMTVNASASLDVQFPPSITTTPADQTVLESDTATFQCNATGNPTPKITWIKDGKTVGEGDILNFVTNRNHSGKYWCLADNELHSTANASANLVIQFPPSFNIKPSDQTTMENEEVTFHCTATGNPIPDITWIKNGKTVGQGNTLSFKAERDHSGKYWCSADNGLDITVNTSASLDVQFTPSLVTIPADQTVLESANAAFHCNATGNPTPKITWIKDGKTVAKGNTLSFETNRTHSGKYWCLAENGLNSTVNASANLDVQFPPSLNIKPSDQTIMENEEVTFHCTATGNPIPDITWNKEGKTVGLGDTLSFKAERDHSGKYWCSADNGLDITVNTSAYLDVQFTPSLVTIPADQTVLESANAAFHCNATGNPTPKITWIKDGKTVAKGNTLSFETNKTHSGKYWCLAENGLNSTANASANLDVQFPPSFNIKPSDQTIMENEEVTFHCTATGNPIPDITWIKDGKTVDQGNTLSFKAERDHSGKYWCSADNGLDITVNTSASLDVQFTPSLVTIPADQTVLESANATFHCNATGNPIPKITWIKDGKTVAKGNTLSFETNRTHSGKYWCLAENGLNSTVNASANLDVQFPPSFNIKPSDQTIMENEEVTFHCTATGNPIPDITWIKDGKTAGLGDTLSFKAERDHSGKYWCSADNGLDITVNTSASLDVQFAPSLITTPADQTVLESATATFHCNATGNPTPKITWIKDGKTVAKGNTLSFETNKTHSGKYWCLAENGLNSTANASANLDVQFPPSFNIKPSDQTIMENEEVTFHCTATSNPIPDITWIKDGKTVGQGNTLNFKAERDHSGKYWCSADNGLDITVNTSASLDVQFAPSLVTIPADQTVLESATATFHCNATGNPTPKITWIKDGKTVAKGNTLSFETNRTHSGKYWCLAENGLNSTANASANLDVQFPPSLIREPSDQTIIEGQELKFHCTATGNPAPTITWMKNGKTVAQGDTLNFKANRSNSGKYWCFAENGLDISANSSAHLDVQFAPSLILTPADQTVIESEAATFHCNATGNPIPKIKWIKDGKNVALGDTLVIETNRTHSGKYWCLAENGLNSTVNASAILDVQFPPSLTTKPSDQTVIENQEVTLQCTATGNPTPTIKWVKDGKTVVEGDTLSFKANRNHSGKYWCTAENGLEITVNTSAYLDVQFPPSFITTPADQTVLESATATFHCNATGNPTSRITWIKDGKTVASGDTLVIETNRNHSGKYWCLAENGLNPTVNASANLDVQFPPSLITKPSNQTIIENEIPRFHCTAIGNPVPKIKWIKDGKTLAEGDILTFGALRNHSGQYWCSAENGLGLTANASAYLDVQFAPSIVTRPTDQTILESSNATFHCSATGNPTPKIAWIKDGKTVATGERLSFEANRNSSGKYWCSANNGLSAVANASANLDVQFPPSLITIPSDKTVVENQEVAFHCSATGNPTPVITWIKDGKTVGQGDTLSFKVNRNHSEKYWCSADNGLNITVNASANLNVLFSPSLTTRPSDQTVLEAVNVTFRCNAIGNPMPKISWIKDGKTVASGDTLSFETNRNHSGKYWCLAKNGLNSTANASADLDVQYFPSFSSVPVNQTVNEANIAMFNCTATGNPTPKITWLKDGKTMATGDSLSFETNRTHSGKYWCLAENGLETAINASAYLDVQFAPRLTTQPSNLTIDEGDEATFQCIATGNPTPKITWNKDGKTVATGETLSFKANRTNSGKYWCLADNGFDTIVNASAYLNVQFPPSLTAKAENKTVNESDQVTFHCTASGNPVPKITWMKDGRTVGTGGTLRFTALRNHSGIYWCSVDNGLNVTVKARTFLDVQYPPTFTMKPSDQIVKKSEDAVFLCTATGNPAPKITWMKDGKTVAHGDTLSFSANRSHSGKYWCLAENGLGLAINTSASLDVQFPPVLTTKPVNQTLRENSVVAFHCSAIGNPVPEVTWIKEGKTVDIGDTLSFTVNRNQSGKYWCSADNGFKTVANASAYLDVLFPPSLTVQPRDQTVIEGTMATFYCSATGNPTPKITWIKDGKTVASGDTLSFETNRNHSGKYWCSAENGLNVTVNASASLDVQFSPSISVRPTDKTVAEGDIAAFHCTATGNPTPKITWLKDGKTVATGETLGFLASRNQSGKYWCSADNGFNKTVNASADLDVQFPPSFKTIPINQTVNENDQTIFRCAATGNPTPRITWIKDEKTVGQGDTLSFETNRNHSGKYWCTAENGLGLAINTSAYLDVQFAPVLTTLPTNQTVTEGNTATFHCSASGIPSPAITWIKDERVVGRGEILTIETRKDHSGEYLCVADNGLSDTANASAYLDVQFPPSFVDVPSDQTVKENDETTFYCSATGNPTPKITWLKDGKTVALGDTFKFVANRNQSGQYWCSVENGLNVKINVSAQLDVQFSPSFTLKPTNETVTEGDLAMFSCAATGNPTPKITWIKSGKTVVEGDTLSFEAFRNQSGEYWCLAENGLNETVNTSAYLDVQFPPSFTTTPIDQTVQEGNEPTFHCRATGNPTPTITWLKDGKTVGQGDTLSFKVNRNHTGKYWCTADNGLDVNINASALLDVQFSPSLITRPANKTVVEGDQATFHCAATGNPTPNIKWVRDGKTVATGDTLSFETNKNHSGKYWCLAENGLNSTVNASAYLDVQFPVSFISTPVDQTVRAGDETTFHCTATGNPTPVITWIKDGKTVTSGQTLTFTASRDHSGQYLCSAENGLGVNINASAHLEVQFAPRLVTIPSNVTVIEGAMATFYCNATGNPTSKITWMKDGRTVATGNTLSFETNRNHSGRYWCLAENGLDETVNASAYLNVQFPLSFTTTPRDQTVKEGDKSTFHCIATGNPTPKIMWLKDGKTVATGDALSFTVNRNQSGRYWCSAENGLGVKLNASALLDVQFSPTFITRPFNKTVIEGAVVTLLCEATGNPTPKITWMKDGKTVATGDTLTFETNRTHSGKYWCLAENGIKPTVNASANIDVQYPPSFTTKPVDQTVNEGDETTFHCTANGNPVPNIKWIKDGTTVGTGDALTFETNRNHLGKFWCTAENGLDVKINASAQLNVQYPPSWIARPTDQIVIEAAMVTFHCSAIGNPVPNIVWLKDGKTVGTGNTLSFKTSRNQSGEYWCSAENRLKTVNTSVNLDVQFPPSFASKPGNQSVKEGDETTFHCTATGNPTPTITWLKDGKTVASGDSFKFTANRNQSGKYWCSAENGLDVYINTSVYLDVQFPPSCTVRLTYQTVIEGNIATFHCDATGNPAPKITWMKDGVTVASGDTLTFEANRNQSGEYWCSAQNTFNTTAKASSYLDVHFKPERTHLSVDADITSALKFGSSVKFNCTADAHPAVDEYRFYRDQLLLGSNNTGIYHLQLQRSASYSCVAVNSAGTGEKATLYIAVKAWKPSFQGVGFGPFYLFKESQVRLPCKPLGEPQPSVKWFKDGTAISYGQNSSYKLEADGTLVITKVKDGDGGRYTCMAQNYLGKADVTAPGILLERTKIVIRPQNRTVTEGTSVVLQCRAAADPTLELRYMWKKDGADITYDSKVQLLEGDSVLKIPDITADEAGVYKCIVFTPEPKGSEDSASAVVSIQGAPSPPRNLQITDCYNRKTNLSWIPVVSDDTRVTHFLIDQESNHAASVFKLVYNVTNPNITSVTLNLPGWATLRFRIRAVSSFGPSRPSLPTAEGICTTSAGAPEKYPANLRGVPKKANELSITWTPMPKEDWNAQGCYYILKYRKVNGILTEWMKEKIGDAKVGTFALTNPGYYQLWEFTINAGNHEGLGPVSPVVRSYSGQNPPAVKPNRTQTGTVTDSKVTLIWEPVVVKRGSIDGYKIYYWGESRSVSIRRKRRDIPSSADSLEVLGGDTRQATLTGLKPYTNYNVVVKAFNSGGEGPASATMSFETLEGEPGPPSDVKIYPFGEYLLVTWTPPKEPNGIITNYQVGSAEYNGASSESVVVTMETVDPNVFKKLLGNERFETSYVVELRARTTKGWGASFRTTTKTIERSAPAKPKKPTVVVTGEPGVVSVTYNFGVGGGWTHEFKVLYRKKVEGEQFQETALVDYFRVQSIEINDLDSALYEFKTIGKNTVGTSPESDITEARAAGNPDVVSGEAVGSPMYESDWFITLIILSGCVLLLLLIVILVKRHRRGRSANFRVSQHEKEIEKEKEIPVPVDFKPREDWRGRLEEADRESHDSLDEYGGTDAYFTEDGSFVGEVSGHKKKEPSQEEVQHPVV